MTKSQYTSEILCLISVVVAAHCYPTGAPAAACPAIYPVGHSGPSEGLSTNLFQLSLSDFDETYGGEFYYIAGQQYNLTLSGSEGELFRGFLVQAVTVADGSPVGVFTANKDSQKLSSCTPAESAVTHNNNSLKSSVLLSWKAPVEGAGDVLFNYATVVQNSGGISLFYATDTTAVLKACGLPLYESSSRCVETCPSGQFGNGNGTTLTGKCQQLPTDYMVALNATIYYAEISADTQLNTPVYRIRISINVNVQPVDISVRFFQTGRINSLFEFKDNTTHNRRDISVVDLQSVGNDRVFDTSIHLVADPASEFGEDDYPVELNIAIHLVVFTQDFISIQALSQGLGSIYQPPGSCENELCQNGACQSNEQSVSGFSCDCDMGWTGSNCDQDIDECSNSISPCKNGGTCTNSNGSFECECLNGFSGPNCEEDIDFCQVLLSKCINGVCVEGYGNETSCNCTRGYTGDSCDEDDPSESFCKSDFCAYGGSCIEGYGPGINCTCVRGFMGDTCKEDDPGETFCDDRSCENEGICEEGFGNSTTCICTHGYTGPTCATDLSVCLSDTCMNGGSCMKVNGSKVVCYCASGFTGMHCETDIDTYCEICNPPADSNTDTTPAIIGGLVAVIVLLCVVAVSGYVLAAFIAKRNKRIFAVHAAKGFVLRSVTSSDGVTSNYTAEQATNGRDLGSYSGDTTTLQQLPQMHSKNESELKEDMT